MNSDGAPEVLIVGGGLSGLACARVLYRAGVSFRLFESADQVGGRVRTDEVEGFLLDRGFQVLLPAYQEARKVLDYDSLDLRKFYRGAEVVLAGRARRLADPFCHPLEAMKSLRCGVVTWRDCWRTLLLKKDSFGARQLKKEGVPKETGQFLAEFGFSSRFIDRFFRPFFGGIFLEKDLRTSAAMFKFLYAMFDQTGAAVPALGMQSIPDQLAKRLPAGSVVCGRTVKAVGNGEVIFEDGEIMRSNQVVLATSQLAAERLLPEEMKAKTKPRCRSVTCLYFATHRQPVKDGVLYLDGDGLGPVNHACVMSNVSRSYAPIGQHLISATVLGLPGGEDLQAEVRRQLIRWFGPQAADWRHLRTYRIQEAQPEETQLQAGRLEMPMRLGIRLVRAGDYCEDVSINGALISGRRAAEEVLAALATNGKPGSNRECL